MVNVNTRCDGNILYVNCEKTDGERFTIVVDKNTLDIIEKPSQPDIDASAVYSRIYKLLSAGKSVPESFVSSWG